MLKWYYTTLRWMSDAAEGWTDIHPEGPKLGKTYIVAVRPVYYCPGELTQTQPLFSGSLSLVVSYRTSEQVLIQQHEYGLPGKT